MSGVTESSDVLHGQYRSHDRLTLRYREFPGWQPSLTVICLPGLLRNARDFGVLAPHLSSRFRVICPDFRGRGASDYAPDFTSYVPDNYVRDLAALYEALDLDEAALIGTSLGGLVATIFSARYAHRVSGLILNDVGPDVNPAGLARIAGYVGKIPPVSDWGDAARAVAMQDAAVYPGFDDSEWWRLAQQRFVEGPDGRVRQDYDPAIGKAFSLPATTPDTWPCLAQLSGIPALLLRGALSDILAPATVTRMRELLPELGFVEVPNRGHVPLLNEPEALQAIDGFLNRLSGKNADLRARTQ